MHITNPVNITVYPHLTIYPNQYLYLCFHLYVIYVISIYELLLAHHILQLKRKCITSASCTSRAMYHHRIRFFFCFSWEYHVRRSCQPIMGRPIAPAKHGYMILIYDIMYTWYYIYIHMSVTMLRTQPASTLYQLLAINFGIDGFDHESVDGRCPNHPKSIWHCSQKMGTWINDWDLGIPDIETIASLPKSVCFSWFWGKWKVYVDGLG